MKNEIFIILFFVIISLGIISANYDSSKKQISIPIKKGWNLIPGGSNELINSASTIKIADFKYAFFFDRYTKKYYLSLKDGAYLYDANKEITSSYTQDDWTYMMQSSFWVYSEKEGDLILNWGVGGFNNDLFKLSNYKLKKGWNFIFMTPEMKGLSIEEFRGSCNLLKICDFQRQNWDCSDYTKLSPDILRSGKIADSDSNIGIGVIIKVSEDCVLGSIISTPPQIPDNSIDRLREDIQNYYYEEFSIEDCENNNYTHFYSKQDCLEAWRCMSEEFAKLIPDSDLKDLADYMKEHGGESGYINYISNGHSSIENQLIINSEKCKTEMKVQ